MAVDLALRLAAALRETNQAQMAEGILEEVLSVAAGNDMARARLRLHLGRIDMERGNVQRAVRHLQLAQVDARATASNGILGEIIRELARARALMGEREDAAKLLTESLEVTTREDDASGPRWEAWLSTATICLEIGFPERAREHLEQAMRDEQLGRSVLGRLKVMAQMGEVCLSQAEWDKAEHYIARALELAKTIGDHTRQAELLIQMGRVRRTQGSVKEGRRYLQSAAEVCRRIGWSEGLRLAQEESDILGL